MPKGKSFIILLILFIGVSSIRSQENSVYSWTGFAEGDTITWKIESLSYNQTFLNPCNDAGATCEFFTANNGDLIELTFNQDIIDVTLNLATASDFLMELFNEITVKISGVEINTVETFSFPFSIDTEIIIDGPNWGEIICGIPIWLILPIVVQGEETVTWFEAFFAGANPNDYGYFNENGEFGLDFSIQGTSWNMRYDSESLVGNLLEIIDDPVSYKVVLQSSELANFGGETSSSPTNFNLLALFGSFIVIFVIRKKLVLDYNSY